MATLPASIEESRAKRVQKQQARVRDRGGIFVPSTQNALVDLLLARTVTGESPPRSRGSKDQTGSPLRQKRKADNEIQKTAKKQRKSVKSVNSTSTGNDFVSGPAKAAPVSRTTAKPASKSASRSAKSKAATQTEGPTHLERPKSKPRPQKRPPSVDTDVEEQHDNPVETSRLEKVLTSKNVESLDAPKATASSKKSVKPKSTGSKHADMPVSEVAEDDGRPKPRKAGRKRAAPDATTQLAKPPSSAKPKDRADAKAQRMEEEESESDGGVAKHRPREATKSRSARALMTIYEDHEEESLPLGKHPSKPGEKARRADAPKEEPKPSKTTKKKVPTAAAAGSDSDRADRLRAFKPKSRPRSPSDVENDRAQMLAAAISKSAGAAVAERGRGPRKRARVAGGDEDEDGDGDGREGGRGNEDEDRPAPPKKKRARAAPPQAKLKPKTKVLKHEARPTSLLKKENTACAVPSPPPLPRRKGLPAHLRQRVRTPLAAMDAAPDSEPDPIDFLSK